MTCFRFDSTIITFDSTEYTFDAICIKSSAINFFGEGDITLSPIMIAGATLVLDGKGTLNIIPQGLPISSQVDFSGHGNVSIVGGKVISSGMNLSGNGEIVFHPGKYIVGQLILNGQGNLEFKRTTELILRESITDLWAEYELVKVSPITGFVEFDKNTVTLSKVLSSIIK